MDTGERIMTLDYKSFVPLYHQLKVIIKKKIEKKILVPGNIIPSEKELCDTYKISRATVRQALQELKKEGLLNRVRGKGTFIAQPKLDQVLEDVYGYNKNMLHQGVKPSSVVISQKLIIPSKEIAKFLNLSTDEKVVFLERIRKADSMVLMLDKAYIPSKLCPGLESMDISGSLYKILIEKYNHILVRAKESLELATADKYIAKHLGISKGTAIIYKLRKSYTKDNTPIEYSKQFIVGDKCRFVIELTQKVINIRLK